MSSFVLPADVSLVDHFCRVERFAGRIHFTQVTTPHKSTVAIGDVREEAQCRDNLDTNTFNCEAEPFFTNEDENE